MADTINVIHSSLGGSLSLPHALLTHRAGGLALSSLLQEKLSLELMPLGKGQQQKVLFNLNKVSFILRFFSNFVSTSIPSFHSNWNRDCSWVRKIFGREEPFCWRDQAVPSQLLVVLACIWCLTGRCRGLRVLERWEMSPPLHTAPRTAASVLFSHQLSRYWITSVDIILTLELHCFPMECPCIPS